MTDKPEASFGARQALPLNDLMAQAGAAGWDFFGDQITGQPGTEASRQMAAELIADQARLAADAARLFETDEGKRILEWLCDKSFRRPMWMMGLGSDRESYAAHREGQNGIVFMLLCLIAMGRGERQPYREGQ